MTIQEMQAKMANDKNISDVDLSKSTSRSSNDDFMTGPCIVKVLDISQNGKNNDALGENAKFVFVEKVVRENNKLKDTGEAMMLYISTFQRSVQPVKKLEEDGEIYLENDGEIISPKGDVIKDWQKAENCKAFFANNVGKYIEFTLQKAATIAAYDRSINGPSLTKTRVQKVYDANWVRQ